MLRDRRFLTAMGAYAVLVLAATVLLTGKIRKAVWILFAGLAIKTIIVVKSRENNE
jgi:hypothetical protein